MKKFLLNILKPIVKSQAVKYIEDEKNKEKIVKFINEKLDLPNMDEAAEEKLLDQIYDALKVAIVDMSEEL
jgi:hypothetical protein